MSLLFSWLDSKSQGCLEKKRSGLGVHCHSGIDESAVDDVFAALA
jgi:hypothetical protein